MVTIIKFINIAKLVFLFFKNIKSKIVAIIKQMRRCGIVLLFLNIILSLIVLLIIKTNQEITYSGVIIYIVAIYDFYLIIASIVNAIRYRRNSSPVLQTSKFINLTVAMISMISLEVAMISEFGNDPSFKVRMTGILGLVVTRFCTFRLN